MTSLTTDAHFGPRPAKPSAPVPLALLPAFLRHALARRAQRRAEAEALDRLRETSAHLLDDVGRADPRVSAPSLGWRAERPAWNAPAHWLR